MAALESRRFPQRAARWPAAEACIRQFLEIGIDLSTADDTHGSGAVYVDNVPMVMPHPRALPASTPEGGTPYLEADLRAPLDLSEPLAVLDVSPETGSAQPTVEMPMDTLPVGSFLAAINATVSAHDAALPGGMTEYLP
jgi:hypothetical protein